MFVIQEPCHENWDDMTPSEKGRHCAVCDKQVVDFTALDPEEGLAMLEQAAKDASSCSTGICGRVPADASGTLQLSKQEKPGPRRRYLSDALAGMLVLSVLGGCYAQPDDEVGQHIEQTVEPSTDPTPAEVTPPVMGTLMVEPKPEMLGEIHCVEPAPEAKQLPVTRGEIYVLQGDIEIEQLPEK